MFIIEIPSGVHYGNCIIGSGDTEAAAWADAYGPKPWTPSQKRGARRAWAREVTPAEYEQLDKG